MRILQLHNKQYSSGGAELQVGREAEALEAAGHPVETIIVDNREVEALGSVRAGVRAVWNRDATSQVRSAIRRFQPDLVHVHTPFPLMSPAVFRTAASLDVPIVATVRSFRYSCVRGTLARDGEVCEACLGRRVKLPAVRHRCYHDSTLGSAALAGSLGLHGAIGTFALVDRYLALSSFMRDRLLAEGLHPDQVTVKPNSVPDPGPPLEQRRPYAVLAGRLSPEKGVETVLRAWEQLEGDLGLVVIGDGDLRPAVEQAAARDGRVEYRGWLAYADTIAAMRSSQLVIVPSEWFEAFGNVVIEGFATGTPVVVSERTNNTGLVEPGVTGAVFETGNPSDLASTIGRMVEDGTGVAWGAAGRRRYLEAYTPDIVFAELLRAYDEVLVARASRGRMAR